MIQSSDSLRDSPVTEEIVATKFTDLGRTMLTLAQFLTGDDTSEFVSPLVVANPWLMLYFASAFLVISVLYMNLITASIVNDAINRSNGDREMKLAESRCKIT